MKLRKLISRALISYDKYRLSSRQFAYPMNVAHSTDSAKRDGQRAEVTNDIRYSENPVQVKTTSLYRFLSRFKKQTSYKMWVSPSFLHQPTHVAFLDMPQI
jgi:hypothetical protein